MKTIMRIGLVIGLLVIGGQAFSQRGPHYRGYNGRNYSSHHYGYHHAGVSFVASLPFGAVALRFGNNPYHYYNGVYYQPLLNGYSIIEPPIGIVVPVLPPGSVSVVIGTRPYYRFGSVFYIPMENNQYQVVQPPSTDASATAAQAPKEGYDKLVIDGKTYYKKGDNYYKARLADNGEIVYEEVGKASK